MEKAKILFLDIDSVLNKNKYGDDLYFDGDKACPALVEPGVPLFKDCCAELEKIVACVPELKIVWSTDWRLYDKPDYNGWKNPRLWIEQNMPDVGSKVVGRTPKKMSSTRPEEIHMWLSDNERAKNLESEKSYDILGYAVIDDYATNAMFSWFKGHFFQTWSDDGLTGVIARQVIECLNTAGYDNTEFRR